MQWVARSFFTRCILFQETFMTKASTIKIGNRFIKLICREWRKVKVAWQRKSAVTTQMVWSLKDLKYTERSWRIIAGCRRVNKCPLMDAPESFWFEWDRGAANIVRDMVNSLGDRYRSWARITVQLLKLVDVMKEELMPLTWESKA